jgi:EmrB/QacA subfamily drug resistance transporter
MSTTQRWTLAVVSAATAMLMLDIAVVNTALPRIADDLNTGLGGLQWVVDAYTLPLAATVLTAGALADRLGRRRVFSVGLVVFTLSSLVAASAGSIEVLNGARAVQGVGGAILFAVSIALLANAFPDERERAKALGIYGATIAGSFAIGPFIGGVLTSGLDWEWVFLINIPIGVASLAITRRYVEESRDPAGRSIDWAGQATLAGGLFLLVLALLRGNDDGWTSALILAEFGAAAVLLAAFAVIERRVREPMLPLGLFKSRSFTGAQLGAFAISGSFFAIFLYVTLYLQQILGLSAIEAGLVYVPGTVMMFFTAAATASLTERGVKPGTLISIGLGLVAVGMLLMTFAAVDSSWTVTLPGSIVAMIGTGLFNPSVIAVALESVPGDQSGLAAGVNDTFRQAGIAVGVAALGALVPAEAALGGGSPVEYVDGFRNALFAGAGLVAAGAVVTAVLLRTKGARGALGGRLAADAA